MREVTERDLRMPEFRDTKPEELEFREDGAIVRKDRWERGIFSVANLVADYDREFSSREFEIPEMLDKLTSLLAALVIHPTSAHVLRVLREHKARISKRRMADVMDVPSLCLVSPEERVALIDAITLEMYAQKVFDRYVDESELHDLQYMVRRTADLRDATAQEAALFDAVYTKLTEWGLLHAAMPASSDASPG